MADLTNLCQTGNFYANYIMGRVELTILTNFSQIILSKHNLLGGNDDSDQCLSNSSEQNLLARNGIQMLMISGCLYNRQFCQICHFCQIRQLLGTLLGMLIHVYSV